MSPPPCIGFSAARRQLVEALEQGAFEAEDRADIEEKNLLFTGDVDREYVVSLLRRCRGTDYAESPHHFDRAIIVHEFYPRDGSGRWYIKAYMLDGVAWMISVHPS